MKVLNLVQMMAPTTRKDREDEGFEFIDAIELIKLEKLGMMNEAGVLEYSRKLAELIEANDIEEVWGKIPHEVLPVIFFAGAEIKNFKGKTVHVCTFTRGFDYLPIYGEFNVNSLRYATMQYANEMI